MVRLVPERVVRRNFRLGKLGLRGCNRTCVVGMSFGPAAEAAAAVGTAAAAVAAAAAAPVLLALQCWERAAAVEDVKRTNLLAYVLWMTC